MRNEKRIGRLVACAAVATLATGSALVSAAPIPLLSYNFNEGSGAGATNTGSANGAAGDGTSIPATAQFLNNNATTSTDLHSANGLGVTGMAGDYALNLTSPTSQGTGPFAARVTRPQVQGLTSFTIAGFFNADEVIGSNARLFAIQDSAGNTAIQVSATAAGVLGFNVNTTASGTASTASYTEVGTYDFFAITYDGTQTTSNVSFYKGTTGTNAAFSTLSTNTVNQGTVATLPSSTFFAYIGNNNSGIRQFDGLLDDVQLYGSTTDNTGALTAAQVQTLYTSEIAVPEPVSMTVIFGGVGLMGLRRRRSSV